MAADDGADKVTGSTFGPNADSRCWLFICTIIIVALVVLTPGLLSILYAEEGPAPPPPPEPAPINPLPRPPAPDVGSIPLDVDPRRPDLVITSFTRTGPPVVRADNTVLLPVRVAIQNAGRSLAGAFPTGIFLPSGSLTAQLTFIVPGISSGKCPTIATLPAGSEIRLSGNVILPSHTRGKTISLYAIADLCLTLITPNYRGDVFESNETNNKSAPLTVAVP